MSDEFVYILDGDNKIIHTIANISDACMIDTIENRSNVYGLNQEAVDEEHWLYCRYCINAPKAEKTEDISEKASAVFGAPEDEEAPKPKRTRKSKT